MRLDGVNEKRQSRLLELFRERQCEVLFDNIGDAIVLADTDRAVVDCNRAFTKLLGYTPEEIRGQSTRVLFDREEDFRSLGSRIRKDDSAESFFHEIVYRCRDGSTFNGEKRIHPIYDGNGDLVGFMGIIRDVTERKVAERRIQDLLTEKEALLQEVHHRVKNNMSSVASLLSLQAETVEDAATSTALIEARSRLQSMEVLYDKLYRAENIDELSLDSYLPSLVNEIVRVLPTQTRIAVHTRVEDCRVPVKVLSILGIIANELVTNSIKHAFTGRDDGMIEVDAACHDGKRVKVVVGDDGKGLPESIGIDSGEGFGLTLVSTLARQIHGTISIERVGGTQYTLTFPFYD